jgi:PAS domain S-box-containing protein
MPHTLNALRCGSVAVDADGAVRHWSAGMTRVFGFAPHEVEGLPLARLWPDSTGPAEAEELLRQAAGEGEEDRIAELVRSDGSRFTARIVAHPLPEGGACVTVIDAGPLGDHLRERGALVQLLQRVAMAANEAESIEDALRTALRHVCRTTGWSLGHAMLVDGDDELVSTGIFSASSSSTRAPSRSSATAPRRCSGSRWRC